MDTIEQVNFQRLIGYERPAQLKLVGLVIGAEVAGSRRPAESLGRRKIDSRQSAQHQKKSFCSHKVALLLGHVSVKSLLHRPNTYFSAARCRSGLERRKRSHSDDRDLETYLLISNQQAPQ